MRSLRLAWLEFQRFRGPILQWVPALVILLPMLASAAVLASLWDPQGRMSRVPAAIVNLDNPTSTSTDKNTTPITVDAGKRLTEQLKFSRSFSWKNLEDKEAVQRLTDGDIFVILYIPRDFSPSVAKLVSGGTASTVHLTLKLNDANGFLVGESAEGSMRDIQEQATSIAMSYMMKQNADMWDAVRRNVDAALNSSVIAQPPLDGSTPAQQPSQGQSKDLQQMSGQLSEAATAIGQINEVLQAANSGSSAMSTQINDAAANSQVAQDNSSSGNAALILQGTTQANTSVRLAQNGLTNLNSQLQKAAESSKGLLERVTSMGTSAKSLSVTMARLEKQLQILAQSIPPASASRPANDTSIVSIDKINLYPAGVLGRGLAPMALSLIPFMTAIIGLTVLRPVNARAVASTLNSFTIARAGWLPLASVCALSTCGFFAFIVAIMQIDARHSWETLAMCLLSACGFSALGYLLKVAFGALGEVLLFVLVALQFGSSGCLYPVQTTNALFTNLHAYLPMTYTVDAFRATISGGRSIVVWEAAFIMLVTTVVCLALSTLILSRRRQWTTRRLSPLVHERCG